MYDFSSKSQHNAQYIGTTMDGKDRPIVASNHILAIELCKEKSWIIVHEMEWGECMVNSISESPAIQKHTKKE
jgi:hypothetical protein